MNRLKTIVILTTVIAYFIIFPTLTISQAVFRDTIDESAAVLPESLRTIDDQAFWGTAFESIKFNGQLVSIGDQTFQNVKSLNTVYIPESTNNIGVGAFPANTVIHVVEGSYAEFWAKENGYQFVIETLMNDKIVKREIHNAQLILLIILVILVGDERTIKGWKHISDAVKSMRPQDRPELYPIEYRFP